MGDLAFAVGNCDRHLPRDSVTEMLGIMAGGDDAENIPYRDAAARFSLRHYVSGRERESELALDETQCLRALSSLTAAFRQSANDLPGAPAPAPPVAE